MAITPQTTPSELKAINDADQRRRAANLIRATAEALYPEATDDLGDGTDDDGALFILLCEAVHLYAGPDSRDVDDTLAVIRENLVGPV